MKKKDIDLILEQEFVCPKCDHRSGHAEKFAMAGMGIFRFADPFYRYAFVSCQNCSFTEIYNLRILEGKDNLGHILEILFMD